MFKKTIPLFLLLPFLFVACQAAAPSASRGLDVAGEPMEAPAAMPELMAVESEEFARETVAGDFGGEAQAPDRLVIKNANLNIVVDDPAGAMTAIALMAEDMGGFVVSSNLFQTTLESGEEVPRASITVRVPAERLNEALTTIEGAANQILSQNVSGEDVTREYVDLQSRLRNLEVAEAQLQLIMDEARRTEDVISVFNQLTQVREQIEVISGQIQYLEQSAAFSAISVELIPDAAVQPLTIGGWQPVGVAKEALQALINALKFLANAAIWLVIFFLPILVIILVPLALIWRGVRRWRARRKAATPEEQAQKKE